MIPECLRPVADMDNGVIVCVGSGKQGKSCTLHSLLGICFPDREKYFLDPLDFDVSVFPGYHLAHEPDEIPVGAIAIIEDVNRVFHSRGSGKDPTLQKWLGVISHKSNIVCLTTQSLASTDLEFFRSQDTVYVHKFMHDADIAFERPEVAKTQQCANEWIKRASVMFPDTHPKAWTFFPKSNDLISIPVADWWGFQNSHMFREVKLRS